MKILKVIFSNLLWIIYDETNKKNAQDLTDKYLQNFNSSERID